VSISSQKLEIAYGNLSVVLFGITKKFDLLLGWIVLFRSLGILPLEELGLGLHD
jgi:hypothetical protein